jgi:hypothetical protein
MSWAPLAVGVSSTVDGNEYADRVTSPGGYISEYVVGYSVWVAMRNRTGSFTRWSSLDFNDNFMARYEGAKPSYHGASGFASIIVLVAAIEGAESLNTSVVRQHMIQLSLDEFYANISFDKNRQLAADMMTIQFGPNCSKQTVAVDANVVFPDAVSSAQWHFPMPGWPIRHC